MQLILKLTGNNQSGLQLNQMAYCFTGKKKHALIKGAYSFTFHSNDLKFKKQFFNQPSIIVRLGLDMLLNTV